ncbi:uncharacterized protein BDW43DRAFT_313314 [Aspergillus alliaceus]|uniref:uncharacterized protein n=1 Tax=Petromyces alliaceus TaxID=209559 RepID=UPI0012A47DE8|nr:uncharacterized protein BDW43DRAFT_313314 [Aspergillus alliaceus]KAB8231240.1 hypothetical protein BDW43DRAFT_313314 [Aspergillus alliaceus]
MRPAQGCATPWSTSCERSRTSGVEERRDGGDDGRRLSLAIIKEAFLVPSNLYRFYLTGMAQLMSQWSGAGSITLYAPDPFKLLGITGSNESLLVTAVFGIVKFVAAIVCALFLFGWQNGPILRGPQITSIL